MNEKNTENQLFLYDVCNDYSLDLATTEFIPSHYRAIKHLLGTVYIHKQYGEVHYLLGAKGLSGKYLYF